MKIALFSYTDIGFKALKVLFDLKFQVHAVLPTNRDPKVIRQAELQYRSYNIPYTFDFGSDNQRSLAALLVEEGIQIGLVAGHSQILKPVLFESLPYGCLNIHPGLLPQFRGQHVINWAIIRQVRKTALALHVITDGIDEGPILMQREVEIGEGETAASLNSKLVAEVDPLVRYGLPAYLSGTLALSSQDERCAKYWPARTVEDGEIKPGMMCSEVCALVRGLARPWPGAWVEYLKKRWHVFDCEVMDSHKPDMRNNLEWHPETGLLLRMADGVLRLVDVEVDNVKVGVAPECVVDVWSPWDLLTKLDDGDR